jgi:SHS family lactate transporter-like MFS transporter
LSIVTEWKTFNRQQRNAFVASYLGWTLDAFDYFLLAFTLKAIATEFGTDVSDVAAPHGSAPVLKDCPLAGSRPRQM